MNESGPIVLQATAVAIGGRALLIEGEPGSGKSTLALALIDRGAGLIGDDAVTLTAKAGRLIASAPPNIAGLLEVRGVGLLHQRPVPPAPVVLILSLNDEPSERLPEALPLRRILGLDIPVLVFQPGSIAPAQRAEAALRVHGLVFERTSFCVPPRQDRAR